MPKSKQRIARRLELRYRSRRNPKRQGVQDMLLQFEDSKPERARFADFLAGVLHRVFSRDQRKELRRAQAR